MSVLTANCPSCAAPLEFKAGSTIVLVCPFCRSAVARTDRGLNDLGKVAEIAESESPLKLGLKGSFKENRFELTGRAQYRHDSGGYWDEWYATFSNGWVGWLAEAQGKFYLTFYQPMPAGASLPAFNDLYPGQTTVTIPGAGTLIVTEKGTATTVAADGEIPYTFEPNERSDYADLSGRENAFGTIDYGIEPPWIFIGNQVSLEDIGLADARPAERKARSVSTAGMGCPNCGGPLSLTAPDKTERVTCPNCESLLDVNQGNLSYLRALLPTDADKNFVLPIGAEGTFGDDTKFKIIGAVTRSVTVDGVTYYWHEYLLYNAAIGFRWLVHSDNHWNFAEPVNAADVIAATGGYGLTGAATSVLLNGINYKIFQDAPARVEYVKGEFYWRVQQGETVRAIDYVSAPYMLSQETTANEVNWSAGKYLPNAEVEKAFGVSGLAKPWSVAPNQPFTGSFYYTWGLVPLLLLFAVAIFMVPFTGTTKTVLSETVTLQPSASPPIVFTQPFELAAKRNVRISASAAFNNAEANLDVDLVNDKNDEIESVYIPISFYQGVEDGESWSEGSPSDDATISAPASGKYSLRVEGSLENITQPLPVTLKVEQNVNRGVNFICVLIVLLIIPIIGFIRKLSFEGRRWRDSMFTSMGSANSDDSSDDE